MATSKKQRQHQIAKIISDGGITSQAALVASLAKAKIDATQATVSRDLEDLGAIKVRASGGGETVYAIPDLPKDQIAPGDHLSRVLGEWVVEINRSNDLVVLKTPPGCAHVVASALDRSSLADLVGTVGGDDTVLAIAASNKGAKVSKELAKLSGV